MARTAALPNLSVSQLEYLDAVSRCETWAAAAAEVGVSPSALSQGLAELERRVGVPLFDRSGRRRGLRPEAAQVLAHAQRVLAQTRDLAEWAAARRSGRVGSLRLGMIDAAAVDHYPDVLRCFRRQRPELDLRLTVAPSGQLLDQVRRGELDVAVVVEPRALPVGLQAQRLQEEPLAIYAPDGARAGDPATWGPWVSFPADSHTRAWVAEALRREGAPFEVIAESHQPEVLKEMVRLALGWAVLPVIQAERQPAPLRRARRAPLLARWLTAVQRSDAISDPAVTALVADLGRRAP